MEKKYKVINVLLPLAIPKVYSYRVAPEYWDHIPFGVRVEVPLRNKLYSGIVIEETVEAKNSLHKLRYIRSVIDTESIITEDQYALWQWMSKYYMCTIGEVMNVALPTGLKLNSETKLIAKTHIDDFKDDLSEKEYILAEAVSIQNELTINQVQDILEQKTVYPIIKSLLDKEIIFIQEELKSGFKPKVEDYIKIAEAFRDENNMSSAFDLCRRSEKQTRALLSYAQLSREQEWVSKKAIYAHAEINSSVIAALLKKGIIEVEKKIVSRLEEDSNIAAELPPLNPHQETAKKEIVDHFKERDLVLLFGITGSGKTRIYIDLIKEALSNGKQVLYLLPEIALTTQIVERLKKLFAEDIGVYHSKMPNNKRVELWNAVKNGKKLILGARSCLFLPFTNLGLVIVDEEHDPSFKQTDPAPRYNGRDTAIYVAKKAGAKVVLGTATPSLETYLNAINDKYAIVKLLERHGEAVLPEIDIVDLRQQHKKGLMRSMFSKEMKDAIDLALAKKEQVLIFQNRRGYSPTLHCITCGFKAECPNCDLSLTVHNFYKELKCHYCGYRHKLPHECPACGFNKLEKLGFGTEKIEDEIKKIFPTASVARMDFDTAKTKNAYQSILSDFKAQEIDILVGTQMITKGLDFENISVVGILAADKILFFPDYKANERAFQLFTQVAGRAGRKNIKGRVIIQTYNPQHPVIQETKNYAYQSFYKRELKERKHFLYPSFYRMIIINIKHKRMDVAEDTAKIMAEKLKTKLANRVIGPSTPGIARLRGFYLQDIIVKMEKNKTSAKVIKEHIALVKSEILSMDGRKTVRININVDP